MYRSLISAVFVMLLAAAGSSAQAAGSELAAALERLHAGELAQQRADADLRARIAAGSITADARADYAIYLRGLESSVAALRLEVARLQGVPAISTPGSVVQADGPESPDQRLSGLDARLQESIGEFDEMLLREREALARKRADTADGGGAGGGPGGSAGKGGSEGSWGQSPQPGGQEGDQKGDQNAGQDGDRTADQSGTRGGVTASREGGVQGEGQDRLARADGSQPQTRGGGPRGATPVDVPDGRDDDVVARQLREAAENETDPKLRERLWQEYRRYKETPR
jgi:hypothetical protein